MWNTNPYEIHSPQTLCRLYNNVKIDFVKSFSQLRTLLYDIGYNANFETIGLKPERTRCDRTNRAIIKFVQKLFSNHYLRVNIVNFKKTTTAFRSNCFYGVDSRDRNRVSLKTSCSSKLYFHCLSFILFVLWRPCFGFQNPFIGYNRFRVRRRNCT